MSNVVSSFMSNFDTSGRVGRVRFTSFLIVGAFFGMIACWMASEDMPSSILALSLITGCAITGWFYGALFWSMPTVTIDLFGPKHFGLNRGLVGLARLWEGICEHEDSRCGVSTLSRVRHMEVYIRSRVLRRPFSSTRFSLSSRFYFSFV